MDSLTAIQKILLIVSTIITVGTFIWKYFNRKIRLKKYNVINHVFTDRKNTLNEITLKLFETNIINVYGNRGVGKSSFLKYYGDIINSKENKKHLQKQPTYKLIKKLIKRYSCLYVEISGYENRDNLHKQISKSIYTKDNYTIEEIAKRLSKRLPFQKKWIIIIDNINNLGLEKEIEIIIQTFSSYSENFKFIIGSIDSLSFINLSGANIANISLKNFKEKDVYEFLQNNTDASKFSQEMLSSLLTISNGLPIFVGLFYEDFSQQNKSFLNKKKLESYISEIIEKLEEDVLDVAQIISILSISQATIPFTDILKINSNINKDTLQNLENNSLIEIDNVHKSLKMHELFRNFINSKYINNSSFQDKLDDIYTKLESCSDDDSAYNIAYLIVLMRNGIAHQSKITYLINNAIQEENYSFLLLFGEHIKTTIGITKLSVSFQKEVFISIIYGYLKGLIGVGDYPAAKEVIDTCNIEARNPTSNVQFDFSLTVAQLYHLQNNYNLAIATYEILLETIEVNKHFNHYTADCFWGIAHSLRHQGEDLETAKYHYQRAIEVSKSQNRRSMILKNMLELLTIYNATADLLESQKQLNEIEKELSCLPQGKYVSTRISYYKYKARHLRTMTTNTSEEEFSLLSKSLNEYKRIKKRLQYNAFFDMGEYFRKLKNFKSAVSNYEISLRFSRKNLDKNLETMSIIGIILCELQSEKFFYFKSIEEQLNQIIYVIETCIDKNLFMNKYIAKIILSKIKKERIDDDIITTLKRLKYSREVKASISNENKDLGQLYLILM